MGADELTRLIGESEAPPCAALLPFTVEQADLQHGSVVLLFDAQPAFSNHFQGVQGGFAAAMLDGVISIAAFALTRRWLPMASLSVSFLRPVPVAPCHGHASVLKIGKKLCFLEGRLTVDGTTLVVAQAALVNTEA